MPQIDMFTMIEQIRKYNFGDGNRPELGFLRTATTKYQGSILKGSS